MSIQAANEIPHTLSLVYNDSMLLSEYEQFKFEYGSIVPKSLTNNNMDFLIETASFLKDNPKTNLEITGHMRATEKDMTPEYGKNIADARAIKIRAQLIRNGIPEKRILTKHATYDGKVLLEPVTFEVKDK